MSSSNNTPPLSPVVSVPPQFLGVLYVATAGQNGGSLGVDEEEIVLLSLAVIHRDSKKVLSSTNFIVHPRGTTKCSSSDINENSHEGAVLSEDARTELGLTDEMVKELGKPLEEVIVEMDSLIRRELEVTGQPSNHLPFAFVTESQLPLRQCVHPEASTKDIKLPEYYYEFFDLRKEFSACYDDAHSSSAQSIPEMVKFLELRIPSDDPVAEAVTTPPEVKEEKDEPETNNNDEQDESSQSNQESQQPPKNYKRFLTEMTAVVMRMLEDATTFQTPEIIMGKLEPGICSKNESVDGNTVVRARGLPWQSSDQDIAKFFRGLNIAKGGVALCLSPQGRRNGEALIRFESQEHRDMALKRHKHHIANRYIEVYKASGEDFLSVAGGSNNEAQAFLSKGGQVIVRMRGLPYDCNAKQVVEFFDSGENACKVLDGEEGVLFVKRPDGRATGDAFVQFQVEEDAANALAKHRELIGSRYIELFRSTTAEVQQVLNRCIITAAAAAAAAQHSANNSNSEPLMKTLPPLPTDLVSQLPLLPASQIVPAVPPPPPSAAAAPQPNSILPQHIITSGTRKDCIRLRGLPYEAQVEHILEFLGEHAKNIVYQGVHMVYNAQGQPSGEAFIQMDSETSAFLAAQSKHHRYMHHFKKQRYIEVFQCSGDDMNLVLTGGVHHHSKSLQSVQHQQQLQNLQLQQQAAAHHHHHHQQAMQAHHHGTGGVMQLHVPANTQQQAPLIQTLPLHHAHHHHHHMLTTQSTTTAPAGCTPIISSTQSNHIAPQPPQTLQYYAHAVSIPRSNGTSSNAATYYHPATVFYWPYPSPPVSPTYYNYASQAGGGQQIGQALLPPPPPPHAPPHHHALIPADSLKQYDSHIRFQEISIDPHRTNYIDKGNSHNNRSSSIVISSSSSVIPPPLIPTNGHHHHGKSHHVHPHHHVHHPSHLNAPAPPPPHPTYMMELGLFMA